MSVIKFPVGVDLAEVPINIMPLVDRTDGVTREQALGFADFNSGASGELIWNFVEPDGSQTAAVVTAATSGDYALAHTDGGMYVIQMPESAGTTNAMNNRIGYGWFSGETAASLPFRGPICEFGVDVVLATTVSGVPVANTQFVLATGSSAQDDTYNGWLCVVRDSAGTGQRGYGVVSNYTGSSRQIELDSFLPATGFTVASGDYVMLIPNPFSLTTEQRANVNAEVDTALGDVSGGIATATALATVDANVDTLVSPYITGTTSGTPTATSSDTSLTGYADSELVGRTIIFTSGTAAGQASRITSYANTSGVVGFKVTTAPAASDGFVIV